MDIVYLIATISSLVSGLFFYFLVKLFRFVVKSLKALVFVASAVLYVLYAIPTYLYLVIFKYPSMPIGSGSVLTSIGIGILIILGALFLVLYKAKVGQEKEERRYPKGYSQEEDQR